MNKPKNAMEIFQLLPKTNCGKCGEKTCLAFAGAVFLGERRLRECPELSPEILERYEVNLRENEGVPEADSTDALKELKHRISRMDLKAAAGRVGGRFSGDRLTVKMLGRDVSVDAEGNLHTEIHINHWIALPLLNYILICQGIPVSGKWITFRELKEGIERYSFFQKRCEEPMKRVADGYPDLFDDMIHIFSGKEVEPQFKSDISVVLYPLPKVPFMICYWLPEEGMDSSLHLFFDETTPQNLDTGSVFTLSTGLAQMFEKFAQRHGVAGRSFAPRP
ncbi:MAG: DUF3786 domain-containing protein [Desulfatiglandaceae bacterium]